MTRIITIIILSSTFVAIACQTKKPDDTSPPEESFVDEGPEQHPDTTADKFPDVGPNHIRIIPTMGTIFGDSNTVYCSNVEYLWNSIISASDKSISGNPLARQLSQSTTWKNTLDTSNLILAFGKPEETYKSILSQYQRKYQQTPNDLTSQGDSYWAYTDKLVRYKYAEPFDEQPLTFLGTKVTAFGFKSGPESAFVKDYFKGQYKILYYNSKGEFVIQLIPENTDDVIILTMAGKENTFEKMYNASKMMIARGAKESKSNPINYNLNAEDELVIPAIRFKASKRYSQLNGIVFSGKYGPIDNFTQAIEFGFDRKGVVMESNVQMADSLGRPVKPKIMRFDKPFYLYIKETKATHPYFNLWVSDVEILERVAQ